MRIEDFGDTVEGRHLDAVIVQKGATPKPAIVIEAGVRPRYENFLKYARKI